MSTPTSPVYMWEALYDHWQQPGHTVASRTVAYFYAAQAYRAWQSNPVPSERLGMEQVSPPQLTTEL